MDHTLPPIIGVGASAGGLEAFTELIQHLPETINAALVFVQHLPPDHESLTPQILPKHTHIPVKKVESTERIQPNTIYLLSQDANLRIENGCFLLLPADEGRHPNHAIDAFFESLARQAGERALAIILSGAATDGAAGIQVIKDHGGTVLVQDPDTAQFDGMPRAAILTDCVDTVLSLEGLANYAHTWTKGLTGTLKSDEPAIALNEEQLELINDLLEKQIGINLRYYKPNTLLRRLEKRMRYLGIDDYPKYTQLLQSSPEEVGILYKNFLIGVTAFFRDGEAFGVLKSTIIPEICKKGEIRIWAPACSTGEEAYSLAILLQEYIREHRLDTTFKIFATDINQDALDFAGNGRYRVSETDPVFPKLIPHFVRQGEEHIKVSKDLRKHIVFARHDVLKDPPFINMDMVVCRNLFIYLLAEVQDKLLITFHYAVKQGGFLFLGANESSQEIKKHFDTVHARWKIFRNRALVERHPVFFQANTWSPQERKHSGGSKKRSSSAPESSALFDELLLKKFAPPCIFINESLEVVYTHGNLRRYLRIPEKMTTFDLFTMLPETLHSVFRNGIKKAQSSEAEIIYKNITFSDEDQQYGLNVTFQQLTTKEDLLLIIFEAIAGDTTHPVVEFDRLHLPGELYEDLEQELRHTREELTLTVQELESTNEELQTANEELLSTNEELQSTNEELQSANDELNALNTELQEKIAVMNELNNDMNNLFNSTEVGTIFLDQDLNIRKFTPTVRTYFNILDSDIGRSITHLTSKFEYHSVAADARQVLETLVPVEREILDENGNYYMIRVLPYKTADLYIKGVVITFVNITELKKVHHSLLKLTDELRLRTRELEKSDASWKSLVDNIPDGIVRYDKNLTILFANRGFERESGVPSSQIIGKTAYDIKQELNRSDEWLDTLKKVQQTGEIGYLQTSFQYDRGLQHYFVIMAPEFASNGKDIDSILTITRNITELKKYEIDLLQSRQQWKSLVDHTPDVVSRFDRNLNLLFVNEAVRQEFGIAPEDYLGLNSIQFSIRSGKVNEYIEKLQRVLQTGEILNHVSEYDAPEGKRFYFSTIVPEYDEGGSIQTVLVISRNITELKRTELGLRQSEKLIREKNDELIKVNEYLDNFVYAAAHDLRSPVANLKVLSGLLKKKETARNTEFVDMIQQTVNRLDHTLNGLVEIIEVQSTHKVSISRVRFADVLQDIQAEFAEKIAELPCTIKGDFDECPEINYVKAYITSIFKNLVSNSLKYCGEGRPLTITIRSMPEDGNVLLVFTDNGMGMDLKKHSKNLFKPFTRLTTKADGKGLGLHLIKNMVEKNSGRIEVESIVDGGTIFKCYLKEYTVEEIVKHP